MGVDGQVGRLPFDISDGFSFSSGLFLQGLQTLLDGVLVGSGKSGVHQVPRIRLTGMHGQASAVLDGSTHMIDVVEVQLWVNALGVEVQGQRHQINVSGTFSMPEQAALHPVGPGHLSQFRGGDSGSPIVVRVQRDRHELPVFDVAAEVLDLVSVGVRGGALDRGRQVEDDLAVVVRLPNLRDGIAHLDGEIGRGLGEDLGAVLISELDLPQVLFRIFHDHFGASRGQAHALGLIDAKDHPPEQLSGRVVHVDGGAMRPDQGLGGPGDQVLPGLGQHRNGYILGNVSAGDELSDEIEIGLGGRREPDLDLLVAQLNEQLEHPHLAVWGHRIDESLVSVAQVGRQPAGRFGDAFGGPGAIRNHHRFEGAVAPHGHGGGSLHGFGLDAGHLFSPCWMTARHTRAPQRGGWPV